MLQESGSDEDAQGEELERELREKALMSMKRGQRPDPSQQGYDSSD